MLTVSTSTAEFGKLFQMLTISALKEYFLMSWLKV